MQALTAFWAHALAAALFASLTLWELRRGLGESEQRMLLAAFALTGCWAWVTALAPTTMLAAYSETARNLVWVGVLYRLAGMDGGDVQRGVKPVYAAVAGVLGMQLVVDALPLLIDTETLSSGHAVIVTAIILRLTAAAGALVLVHNFYGQATPSSRSRIRLAMVALATMWAYDLNLYTIAYFDPASAKGLFDWRGLAIALVAPLFVVGGQQDDRWRIRLSRAATFQSLSAIAITAYVAVMAVLVTALRGSGFDWTRALLIALLAAMTVAAIVLLPSRRARGWAKVKIAKHLFEHRYDYRTEWLRFTETIGASGSAAPPLGQRVIKAFADILDAPGGLLLVADEHGAIEPAAAWNWSGSTNLGDAIPSAEALAFWLSVGAEGRIIDFDSYAGGWAEDRDREVGIPGPFLSEEHAWTGIPLIHDERLVGLVLLAAPDYRRPLDWEDFDLLRTAGRQAASSLAEANGQQALMNAQRFEDFNRRFAFILHDVKNLVSQLSLLTRNAERHADNAEFRADMVATLKGSVGKMNELLARLAPTPDQRPARLEPTPLRPLVASAIAAKRRDHEVRLLGDGNLCAMADPLLLEQAIGHLVQNAVDASTPLQPVTVRMTGEEDRVVVSVADTGTGMDADFVRTRLFQPFASTKQGGFGVGAFEAKSLVAAMGGRLTVDSKPGEGSNFTITLAAAQPAADIIRKRA
ncbi:XrtA/PEP-CTERM system histidine kinase PrsK [Sphingomonas xanthus]|uniref:histidine kinase n=1 Tax=Sphingomonas xanthus TaxID=2594473 RepID=A0A516ISP5_9SPHN|nr:XrtA/PEP-CTERM system histidine kinase PrsK [Sphingomonas xanthus]QDP19917.1 PEP-CTERM system histidine kinase PrsK [Sphingomonas xanthus]